MPVAEVLVAVRKHGIRDLDDCGVALDSLLQLRLPLKRRWTLDLGVDKTGNDISSVCIHGDHDHDTSPVGTIQASSCKRNQVSQLGVLNLVILLQGTE